MRALTNLSQARMSEKRIEDMTGLTRTPGSGCGKLFKGDNGNKLWHVEDKSTRQSTVRVYRKWIEKTKYQAAKTGKRYWALGISSPQLRVFVVDHKLFLDANTDTCFIDDCLSVVDKKSAAINLDRELPIHLLLSNTEDPVICVVISELRFRDLVNYYAVQNPD